MIGALGDDVLAALVGLRVHLLRTVLTVAGVALGVGSLVAVVGISASSRADLVARIRALGTDLLVVEPGTTALGREAALPAHAAAAMSRLGTVATASATVELPVAVRRNGWDERPNGLSVVATEPSLFDTVLARAVAGRVLAPGSDRHDVAVLGWTASERLGIRSLRGGPTVTIGRSPFQVIGVLAPLELHPDLDRAVLIGRPAAAATLGLEAPPTRLHVRVDPEQVEATRPLLARAARPGAAHEVEVSRPSDALAARAQVDRGLRALLLAVGTVALVVAGFGIANLTAMAVWERVVEIGIRRALGATAIRIARQFLAESTLVALLGGVGGGALGAVVTVSFAVANGWRVEVPAPWLAGSVVGATAMGALAGVAPAIRAARIDPVVALRG